MGAPISSDAGLGAADDWLTPRFVLDALGVFDLDPCASGSAPTWAAPRYYRRGGLEGRWDGRVWLAPPGRASQAGQWLERLSVHRGGGTALLPARTDCDWWHRIVGARSAALLFLRGRLMLLRSLTDSRPAPTAALMRCGVCGHRATAAPGPMVVAAFGVADADLLEQSQLDGWLVRSSGRGTWSPAGIRSGDPPVLGPTSTAGRG